MRLRRRQFIAATLLSLAVGPGRRSGSAAAQEPPAPARTLFVDQDAGDDDNPGSREEPFETIAHAATRIEPGDRVEIADGAYDETVVIDRAGTLEAPITFAPMPGADVRLEKGGVRISADHVVLDGLTIEDVDDDDSAGVFITRGTGVQLRNLTVRGHDGDGIRAKPTDGPIVDLRIVGGSFNENRGAGIAATGEDALVGLVVENVTVADNAGDGLQVERASQVTVSGVMAARNGADDERNGVFLKNVRGASIRGVFSERNGHNGIALRQAEEITISRSISTGNGHHGFDSIEDCRNITFANNVSYANGDKVEDKGLYITATAGVTILNNIFLDNAGDQIAFSDEGGPVEDIVSNYNLFWRSSGDRLLRYFSDYFVDIAAYQAASGLDGASLAVDPRLVAPADNNYEPMPDSPAIDAGTAVPGVTDDSAGTAPDIGVHEHRPE